MASSQERNPRDEVLAEIRAAHEKQHALASTLLSTITERRAEIANKLDWFKKEEPDLVYRLYHQSYKTFIMVDLIQSANELFSGLAPESTELNDWYVKITQAAISKKFDPDSTNQHWLEETLPILQGFWQAKYFLEQMLAAAGELDEAPRILPSGWAAVLYLYNLR